MKCILTAERISKDEFTQTIRARDDLMGVMIRKPRGRFLPAHDVLHPNRKRQPVNVLLAENRAVVRLGICALLARDNGINVIGHALDGEQAVELSEQLQPDVVIISFALAFLNRMQAIRHILHRTRSPRVIILARHRAEAYANHAATLGVTTWLTEQVSGQMLTRAVREAHQAAPLFASGLSCCFPETPRSREAINAAAKMIPQLTSRQRQILQLIAEGNANKQTAADLSISVKTVEKHRDQIMAKLGIHETAGLTRYAIATGIVESEFNPEPQPKAKPATMLSQQKRWMPHFRSANGE